MTNVIELIHPNDRALFTQHRTDSLQGLNKPPVTIRAIKQGGQIITIESWSTPIRDSDGKTVGYFGTVQDVTERLRQQAALQESRDNLARAEAMVQMGHFEYDSATNTYIWSDGLFHLMGMSRDTFTPTPDSTLQRVHPDDRAILIQYRQDALSGKDVGPMTIRAIKGDGSDIIVEVWSSPLRADDGSISGMFGTTRDVTARRRK